jgi:hypothetical protein
VAERVPQIETEAGGRAIVALGAEAPRRPMAKPFLPLVAQLLAVRLDLPQARARRREAPAQGAAAYAAGRPGARSVGMLLRDRA